MLYRLPHLLMSNKSIIELVKDYQKALETEHDFESWCESMMRDFPVIAQGFQLAYQCLRNHEHLVRGECLDGCDMCQTLKAIRSLPLSS